MIARLRGEHHDPWARWRPTPARPPSPAAEPVEVYEDDAFREDPGPPAPGAERPGRRSLARVIIVCFLALRLARTLTRWLLALAAVSIAYVAITWVMRQYTPHTPALPGSPRAWLTAYEAAAIDNPSEVCSQLFSPQLAASYAHQAHESCRRYFARMTSSSLTVRRILEQNSTAVLELRQTLDHHNWAVVLDHRTDGWQAVDLLGY